MNNKFSNQITKYWRKLNKEKLHMCSSISLFRILYQNKITISKKKKFILDYNYFKIGEIKNFYLTKNIIFIVLFILNLLFIYLYLNNHNTLFIIPSIILTIYLLYVLSENYFEKQNKTNNIINKINNN